MIILVQCPLQFVHQDVSHTFGHENCKNLLCSQLELGINTCTQLDCDFSAALPGDH